MTEGELGLYVIIVERGLRYNAKCMALVLSSH